MRFLRHFIAVCVLISAFSLSAVAGEMQTPGVAAQPPSRLAAASASETQTPDSAEATLLDPVMEAFLFILQNLLPLV